MAGAYGAGASGAHIKVTTEVLQQKAMEAERQINQMKKSLDEIKSIMARTSVYWEGEAGTLYRETYQKQNETVLEILKNIQEYPTKLQTIAGVFASTEQQNTGTANELKSDLL